MVKTGEQTETPAISAVSFVCAIKKDIVLLQIIILQTYIIVLLELYNLQFLNYKKKAI